MCAILCSTSVVGAPDCVRKDKKTGLFTSVSLVQYYFSTETKKDNRITLLSVISIILIDLRFTSPLSPKYVDTVRVGLWINTCRHTVMKIRWCVSHYFCNSACNINHYANTDKKRCKMGLNQTAVWKLLSFSEVVFYVFV